MLVQKRRNKAAALRRLRKLLRRQAVRPEAIVTDGLKSDASAATTIGLARRHRPARLRGNNRAENAHRPIRRRARVMQRFKSQGSAQRFLSTHAIYNVFYSQRHLASRRTMRQLRSEAHRVWAMATTAA